MIATRNPEMVVIAALLKLDGNAMANRASAFLNKFAVMELLKAMKHAMTEIPILATDAIRHALSSPAGNVLALRASAPSH